MLQDRQVEWVFVCDWDRLGQDFASLLELGIPQRSMGSDFGSRPDKVRGIWFYRVKMEWRNCSDLLVNCKKLSFTG
jgi:hypothetical protein